MTAHFPFNLPELPPGPSPWRYGPPDGNHFDETAVDGVPHTRIRVHIEADDAQQAERRVLSVLYARYHEDLHGAHATAIGPADGSGRWEVAVFQPIGSGDS